MRTRYIAIGLLAASLCIGGPVASRAEPSSGHYIFAWTGDLAKQGNDFLAVIDADPASASYGELVTTLPTDQQTVRIHHTEYVMPESGMLFANDHDIGRTFIFDVRDPKHPSVATSFSDLAGYMHPHSFLRLPNGHVLASFQHDHLHMASSEKGTSGGLVEIDDQGHVIRSASNADKAFPDALLMPYSLVVMPKIDRVLVTNSSMHRPDQFSGTTYQIFRLSDLKLLKTAQLDGGSNHYGQISPEEPRLGPDGAVYIQTLACGLERITGIDTPSPKSTLVYTFPGNWCGVPTIVGHYLIQSVPRIHGLIALDIANGAKPVEVSRIKLSDKIEPHWTGWDIKTHRLVVTGYEEQRLFMVKFDETSGILSIDQTFKDSAGNPGFDFADRDWPHDWHGSGLPHGVVFSR